MIRLFVYGTLRPGGELADNLRWSYADEPRLARVRGLLYVNPDSEGQRWEYPVLVADGAEVFDDFVTGHLLTVFDDDNVRRTVLMELQAGYEARHLPVSTPNPMAVGGYYTPAGRVLTFTWPECRVGQRITSGDWFTHCPPRTTNHKENAPGT